jgi:hypothetical protein
MNSEHDTPVPSLASDRLLTFREAHLLIGSQCRTGHTARKLAAQGMIDAVYLSARTIRYTAASVRELIAGQRAPGSRPQLPAAVRTKKARLGWTKAVTQPSKKGD